MKLNRLFNAIFIIVSVLFAPLKNWAYIPDDTLFKQLKIEKNSLKIVDIYNELSWNLIHKKLDLSKKYMDSAYNLSDKINYNSGKARALANMAYFYTLTGDYLKSGEKLSLARKIAEKDNDLKNLSRIYARLSTNYDLISLNEKAIEYAKKALEVDIKINNEYNMAMGFITVAYSSLYSRDTNTIINSLKNASNFIPKYYYSPLAYSYYSVYSHLKYFQNDFIASRLYLDSAFFVAEQTGNIPAKCECYILFGNLDFAEKKYKSAEKNAFIALNLAKEYSLIPNLIDVYKLLADVYGKLRQFEKSNLYLNLAVKIKDSLFSESNLNKLQIIQSQFDFDLKEAEMSKKDYENKIHTERIEKQNIQIVSLIFLSFIGIIFTYLIFKFYRKEKKYSEVLNKRNEEISTISAELNEKNLELEKLNATKDKYFSIIGHDLRNPIGGIKNLSSIFLEYPDKINQLEVIEVMSSIHKASGSTYELLENLLQWAKTQSGGIRYEPSKISCLPIISRNLSLIKHSIEQKGLEIIYIPEHIYVYCDNNLLDTIIRNLLSNAVKFTPYGGKITINVNSKLGETDGDYILFEISDTGVGISPERINDMFSINMANSTKGTNNESGSGLGLILCKEFVELQGGRIWVESEEGKGSSFYFTIPLA